MAPTSSSMNPSSAYAFKPGGPLKFKGGDAPNSSKKKKKKSRSSTSHDVHKGEGSSSLSDRAVIYKDKDTDGDIPDDSKLTRLDQGEDDEDTGENGNDGRPTMTEAERKFDTIRKNRMAERVLKQAKLSHKDRVDAFNRDLESRTEHFAMGRVGGGG